MPHPTEPLSPAPGAELETTSFDQIRAAERLMRERAEAASTWEPAAWFAANGAVYGGTAAPHQVITPVTTYDGDAEHIASWHPAVALDVADWLARVVEPTYCASPGEWASALTIARTYLGEEGDRG